MVDINKLDIKPFEIFNKTWGLLTSGTLDNHNSMTISWGEMGTLWNKNVITIYVKPCRYTYQFMEDNDYFVVSFFDEEYKSALGIMGSKSGKNVDKDALSGLTPESYKDVTIYKEAKLTFICKKIYYNDLDINIIPEQQKGIYYQKENPHRMYMGEIIDLIIK